MPGWPLCKSNSQGKKRLKQYTEDRLGADPKVCVIGTSSILNTNVDSVVINASLTKVIGLKIERLLSESVLVQSVMPRVDEIESVGTSSVRIQTIGRFLAGVVGVIEYQTIA